MDYDSNLLFQHNKTGRDSNVRNVLRQGKVIERLVDDKQCSCRVQWLDKQGLISRPLPVLQSGSRSTNSMYCPKIGDNVDCMMLPNSDGGDGFIIGSFYSTSNPPPTLDPDTRITHYADGTIISYTEATETRAQGLLRIQSEQPINIVSGPITITASDITLTGNVKIEGELKVSEDIRSDKNIRATVYLYDQRGVNHN